MNNYVCMYIILALVLRQHNFSIHIGQFLSDLNSIFPLSVVKQYIEIWVRWLQLKWKQICAFVSIKLSSLSVLTYVTLFKLMHLYNNNYNKNYSFVILICLQRVLKVTIARYSSHMTIYFSAHNLLLSANLYSLDLYNLVYALTFIP